MTPTTKFPSFGAQATATQATEALSDQIRGKTIIITGVSPGSLGEALATAISKHAPALLILASRTPSKLSVVSNAISSKYPELVIKAVQIDLSSFQSVRRAAEDVKGILGTEGRIDVLFNNAGVNVMERTETVDGIETQFATNSLGPFLFTNLLLPLLTKNAGKGGSRVVNVSSEAHRLSGVRFSDWNFDPNQRGKLDGEDMPRKGLPENILREKNGYARWVAYGQSKTANILFSVELNRRFGKLGIKSWALHPGTIMTDLPRDMDAEELRNLREGSNIWKSPDQGASTMIVAGFDPILDVAKGIYLDDCQLRLPARWASDTEKADRFWQLSEKLVGEKFGLKESRL